MRSGYESLARCQEWMKLSQIKIKLFMRPGYENFTQCQQSLKLLTPLTVSCSSALDMSLTLTMPTVEFIVNNEANWGWVDSYADTDPGWVEDSLSVELFRIRKRTEIARRCAFLYITRQFCSRLRQLQVMSFSLSHPVGRMRQLQVPQLPQPNFHGCMCENLRLLVLCSFFNNTLVNSLSYITVQSCSWKNCSADEWGLSVLVVIGGETVHTTIFSLVQYC